jgi:2-polyprenyl-6-hydroxyphenyl methylase/3-demethylubiquinone-9 3-methyltransferase
MLPIVVKDPGPAECKVCGGASPLCGVVDFQKSCIEAQGKQLPLSGAPVYYRRCQRCAFLFSMDFDSWDLDAFRKNIYNDEYVVVDPDYVEVRPAANATVVANSFRDGRDAMTILDYGGGSGLLAARLRDQGFRASTYDPFSSFNQMPVEQFDLITCFEVMEHVPFPQKTAAEMVSLMKKPGAILFSTVVQPADINQIGLHWWYASPRNGHISLHSTASLALLFQPYSLKVASFSAGLHMAYGEIPAFAAHLNLPR